MNNNFFKYINEKSSNTKEEQVVLDINDILKFNLNKKDRFGNIPIYFLLNNANTYFFNTEDEKLNQLYFLKLLYCSDLDFKIKNKNVLNNISYEMPILDFFINTKFLKQTTKDEFLSLLSKTNTKILNNHSPYYLHKLFIFLENIEKKEGFSIEEKGKILKNINLDISNSKQRGYENNLLILNFSFFKELNSVDLDYFIEQSSINKDFFKKFVRNIISGVNKNNFSTLNILNYDLCFSLFKRLKYSQFDLGCLAEDSLPPLVDLIKSFNENKISQKQCIYTFNQMLLMGARIEDPIFNNTKIYDNLEDYIINLNPKKSTIKPVTKKLFLSLIENENLKKITLLDKKSNKFKIL